MREVILRMGIPFPIVVDANQKIFRDYLCDLWPSQFVIDRNRNVHRDGAFADRDAPAAHRSGLMETKPQRCKYIDRLARIHLTGDLRRKEVTLPVEEVFRVETPLIVAPAETDCSVEYGPASQSNRVGIVVKNGTQVS